MNSADTLAASDARAAHRHRRRLDAHDAAVHRCTGCGSWLYASLPCGACGALAAREHDPRRGT